MSGSRFEDLQRIAERLTKNLNNIIDYNYYPIPETRKSNLRHRPIGIGVQGLANVFFEFGYAFDSDEAKELNDRIFECIYYGSLKASMNIAKSREELMKTYKIGPEERRKRGQRNPRVKDKRDLQGEQRHQR